MKKVLLILVIIACRSITMADNPGHNKTSTINNLDTIVFDLSKEVINGNNVQFPVSVKSDDTVDAVDFSMKINLTHLTYDSIANLKPYLTPFGNFNGATGRVFVTSSSLQPIEHNMALISVYFDATTGKINKSDLDSMLCYLNGDPCACKVIDYTVGISEFSNNVSGISIYPNPARGFTMIQFTNSVSENYTLTLEDLLGRTVGQEQGRSIKGINKLKLDLSALSKGIYILNIKTEKNSFAKRVIVE